MKNNILFAVSTPFEIAPLLSFLNKEGKLIAENIYDWNENIITICITGIGIFNMSYHCGYLWGSGYKPQLAINTGLCGSFEADMELTTVVNIYKDTFADVGVTERDGSFTSIFDLDLVKPDEAPFKNGWLENDSNALQFLPHKTASTVNKTSGNQDQIDEWVKKYHPQTESMEGAAFAYSCMKAGINYLQIRGISNYVQPRNKFNWKIDQTIDKLNSVLIELLKSMP